MSELAWVFSVITGIYIGYKHAKLEKAVKDIQIEIDKRRDKRQEKEQENPSTLLDPDDLETQVRLEHERKMKQLNPDRDFE